MGDGNYVEILVKSRDQAKPDMDDLRARLAELGRQVETARAEVDDADAAAKLDLLSAKLSDIGRKVESPKITMSGAVRAEAQVHAIEASLQKLGGSDAEEAADGVGRAADRIGRSLEGAADKSGEAGRSAGSRFVSNFASWLKPSRFQAITSALSSSLAALPALGAVAGAGMVAAMGFSIANQIPSIHRQFAALGQSVLGTLERAVKPMLPFIKAVVRQVGGFFRQIEPELSEIFGAAGPLLMPLTKGLEGLVRGVLPGLLDLMKAAAPAVRVVSQLLAGLGRDLGGMFKAMAPAVKASSDVLRALGSVLNGVLPVIGKLASVFARALGPVLLSFGKAIRALAPALEEIGRIAGKLAGAVLGSLAGALKAIAQAVGAAAPGIRVLASALGHAFSIMENSGVFGILEDALEKIAGPLGRLVSDLATGLAPVLPPVMKAITQIANALTSGLSQAVLSMMPGLTELARTIGQLAVAMTPLIPSLVQLDMALLKILLAFTPLLPAVLDLVNLLARLATDVIAKAVPWIEKITKVNAQFASVIAKVAGWVVKIIARFLEWISNIRHLREAWDEAAHALGHAFEQIVAGAVSMAGRVEQWFGRLPGRVLHAVAGFGRLLWHSGQDLLRGLLGGIESMVSEVVRSAEGVGKSILHGIEGALGIASPSREGHKRGQLLALGVIGGMDSMRGAVAAAAGRMGAAMIPRMPGPGGAGLGLAGAGGHGQVEIIVRMAGGDEPLVTAIMRALRLEIRTHGGGGKNSVQRALGQRW